MNSDKADCGRTECPSCRVAGGIESLYALADIPVQSTVLIDTREQALAYPTGAFELAWCRACGFAFNRRFDAARVSYGEGYEDSQGSSPTFQRMARALARGWIERYDLRGKKLLEIGCGKGEFLRLMCDEGDCTGVGYDPAFVPGRVADTPGLHFVIDNFDDRHVPADADFILCRHTLEHIPDVGDFLGLVRRACGERDTVRLGFEIPDLKRILEDFAFWDLYYEHCSYFTIGSLARAFTSAGFDVLDLQYAYGDQYLIIEAKPAVAGAPASSHPLADDLDLISGLTRRFKSEGRARVSAWRDAFHEWRASGRRIALWGSGSKAVSFLTTIGNPEATECVVDINPRRQGKYMPGLGMPIVAPTHLISHPPEIVIVMNSIYREEITATLAAMDLAPEVYVTDDARILAVGECAL